MEKIQHCRAESKSNIINKAVYYSNDIKNLTKLIETIKKSEKIEFNEYMFKNNFKKNVNSLMNKFY